jgi:hypothetical protein
VSVVGTVLETRMTFELAALLVTWIAVTLLALIVVSLHLRVQHLERASAVGRRAAPYSHLLGRSVEEALGRAIPTAPRLVLLVSSGCRACERILDELASTARATPSAVAWIDGRPGGAPALPSDVTVLDDGPNIGAHLGVRVTPFVLVADAAGAIVRAAPINSLGSLGDLGGEAAETPLGRLAMSS